MKPPKPLRPYTPLPTNLFEDVKKRYAEMMGQWQPYTSVRDKMPVRAVYRRATLDQSSALVILRNVNGEPVSRLVIPHEDLSEADRETMLQSMLSLYLLQNFKSE